MKRVLFIFLFAVTACQSDAPEIVDLRTEEEKNQPEEELVFEIEASNEANEVAPTPVANSRFSYKIIEGENGWGYQIFEDSVLRIKQEHIPSLPGTRGFDTKERAEKTARYVVKQMDQGVFPPTMNPETLKKIGAID